MWMEGQEGKSMSERLLLGNAITAHLGFDPDMSSKMGTRKSIPAQKGRLGKYPAREVKILDHRCG
jgi:hypothetical protein